MLTYLILCEYNALFLGGDQGGFLLLHNNSLDKELEFFRGLGPNYGPISETILNSFDCIL